MPRDLFLTESVESLISLTDKQAREIKLLSTELAGSKEWWGRRESGDERVQKVIEIRPYEKNNYLCTVRNAVGILVLDGVRIFSQPKIPWDHFVYIARHSIFGDARVSTNETLVGDGQSFLDLIATWFIQSVTKLLEAGLALDYELRAEPLRYVRGRIEPVKTFLGFQKGVLDIHAEYEERTINCGENRIIRSALDLLEPDFLGNDELKRGISRLRAAFSEVDRATDFDLQIPAKNFPFRYRRPIELAKALLNNSGLSLSDGTRSAQSFLVRTPRLIEDGIRSILNKGLSPVSIRSGGRVLVPTSLTVNPDLLIARPPFTADVKYKRFGPSWDRRDLAQSVFFAESFRSPIAAVIGFSKGELSLPLVPVGRIGVSAIGWDISPESSPEDSAQKLIDQFAQWIPDSEKALLGAPK